MLYVYCKLREVKKEDQEVESSSYSMVSYKMVSLTTSSTLVMCVKSARDSWEIP